MAIPKGNVVEATQAFQRRRLHVAIQERIKNAIDVFDHHLYAVGISHAMFMMKTLYEQLQELPKDISNRIGNRLFFCEHEVEQSISKEEDAIAAVKGRVSIIYQVHKMLDLDESEARALWEGHVIHVLEIEAPCSPDESVLLQVVPWDKDQFVFVDKVLGDEEDTVFDLTLPVTQEVSEHRMTLATVYATLFNALGDTGFDRAHAAIAEESGKPKPRPHLIHAARYNNKILLIILDVQEMLRLENQYVDHLEFHGL